MARRLRARGALLGLAVGDALGTTLEFSAPVAPAFPGLCDGPHREIVGGGPFRVAVGQVTDDTQLACCLGESLRERGVFDAKDVWERYRTWRQYAFDIGTLTARALAIGGREAWEESGRRSAGNGSLMRTAPIGVFFYRAEDAAARREASSRDSSITHHDPRCRLACVAFNAAIAAGVRGGDAEAMVAAAAAELDGELAADLAAARADDPQLYGPELHLVRTQGFVRVAFRLAFWELLHAPSFEAGLIDVVNRGGDADTNGAIAGALLGARHGEEAIPSRWRDAVLLAVPPAPWDDLYHPRRLLALAERA